MICTVRRWEGLLTWYSGSGRARPWEGRYSVFLMSLRVTLLGHLKEMPDLRGGIVVGGSLRGFASSFELLLKG
jgi:hypothetical protein